METRRVMIFISLEYQYQPISALISASSGMRRAVSVRDRRIAQGRIHGITNGIPECFVRHPGAGGIGTVNRVREPPGQAWMRSFKFREMLDYIAGVIPAEVPAAHAADLLCKPRGGFTLTNKNWDPVSIVVLTGLGASGLRMQRSWPACHLRRHSGLHWWEACRREPC